MERERYRLCIRRDIDKNFKENNPILLDGEVVYVKDEASIKIGNGLNYNGTEFFYNKNEITELQGKVKSLESRFKLSLIGLGCSWICIIIEMLLQFK